MEKRLVDLTKSDALENDDYLFVNHGDNPVQVSFPFVKERIAPIDNTLSESGKYADAKTTGDKINKNVSDIELINTEIKSIKSNYATKEEAETKSHAEETFATKTSLSVLESNLNDVKEDYLSKEERDVEFYEGRKYNGMTYAGKTSDKGVQLYSVKGKTVQQKTNGYQLFDASKLSTKSQGGATVTNNDDGSFTVSGSGSMSGDMNTNLIDVTDEVLSQLKVGKIYANFGAQTYPYCVFKLSTSPSDIIIGLSSFNSMSDEAEITEDILSRTTKVYLQFYGASGKNIVPGTIKPMIYQDGDGTWEPYTGGKPAPNPDYPMEIENVEINKVFSSSGNMLNLNWDWEHEKVSYTITDDKTIKATVTNKGGYPMLSYVFSNNELEFIKGKYIKLLYDKKESSKTTSIFQANYKSLKGSNYITSSEKRYIPKDTTRFVAQLVIVNSDNLDGIEIGDYATFAAPRIIVGDVEDTSWKPYGFSAIGTSLTLAEGDIYENGQVTRVRKQITFDGSSDELMTITNIGKTNRYLLTIPKGDGNFYSEPNGLCNVLKFEANYTGDYEHFYVQNNQIFVFLNTSRANTVEELRTWLSTHPLTIEYELATPTTEELKIPTVPSYFPYTDASTDNTLETDITWKVLADCDNSLKQEELEQRILALETKVIE